MLDRQRQVQERIRLGSWTLTRRGERVFIVLTTICFFMVVGFVGWLENL